MKNFHSHFVVGGVLAVVFAVSTTSIRAEHGRMIVLDASDNLNQIYGVTNLSWKESLKKSCAVSLPRYHPKSVLGLRTFAGKDSASGSLLLAPKADSTREFYEAVQGLETGGEGGSLYRVIETAIEDLQPFDSSSLTVIAASELANEPDSASLSAKLTKKNIRLIAIALGDKCDFSWLGKLASEAGGTFQRYKNNATDEQVWGLGLEVLGGGKYTYTPEFLEKNRQIIGIDKAALVRVKPADIGPKEGDTETAPGVTPKGEASPTKSTEKSAGTLEIIFDASNSMNAKIGGIPKIDLAKKALYHLSETLEHTTFQTGLRVFGHDKSIDREDRPRACVNSELVVGIAPGNAAAIRRYVPKISAWGRTPIAYSLQQAGKDLSGYLEANPNVLLISDGVESCDGNPPQVIQQLNDSGVKMRTHVIGFDLNAKERQALKSIAAAGNGKYYDAQNYSELIESLDQFTGDVKAAEPPKAPVYLNPVLGGPTQKGAVTVGPGLYTLAEALGKDEHAWFRVESKKSQRVGVRVTVQGKRIYYDRNGKRIESTVTNGAASAFFPRMDRPERPFSSMVLSSSEPIGKWMRIHRIDTTGDGTLFALKPGASPNALFEVIVQEAGDLYEGWEAPDSIKSADLFDVPINDTFFGHIGAEDREDAFRITLGENPPASLQVKISFSNIDTPVKHRLEFFNGDTKRRILGTGVETGQSKVTVPVDGAKSMLMLISDTLANSVLRTYVNSYELRIETE